MGTWYRGTGEPLKAVCREGGDQQTAAAPLSLGLALGDGPSRVRDGGDPSCPVGTGRQDPAKGSPAHPATLPGPSGAPPRAVLPICRPDTHTPSPPFPSSISTDYANLRAQPKQSRAAPQGKVGKQQITAAFSGKHKFNCFFRGARGRGRHRNKTDPQPAVRAATKSTTQGWEHGAGGGGGGSGF